MKIDESIRNVFNEIIQIRDKNNPCIICGYPLGNNSINVCHYIKKSQSSLLKFKLSNAHLGHQWCNQKEEYDENFSSSHALNVLEREGLNEYMLLNSIKRQTIKFGSSEKKELLSMLKIELKNYKR